MLESRNLIRQSLKGLRGGATYDRLLKALCVFLEFLHRMCLILCTFYNSTRSLRSNILEDALKLFWGWWILGDVELKLLSAPKSLTRVVTGLILGSMFPRNRRSLLEESVHLQGCRRACLVKECDYVERFILFGRGRSLAI